LLGISGGGKDPDSIIAPLPSSHFFNHPLLITSFRPSWNFPSNVSSSWPSSSAPGLGPGGCRRKGRLRWAGGVQDFPELFQIGKYFLPLSPGFLQDSYEPSGVIILMAVNPDNIAGKNEFAGQNTLPGHLKKIPKEHGA